MAVVRNDIIVDFYSSPRIFEVKNTQNTITVQETVNLCREIEYEWQGLAFSHLINAAGKEDLGGGVKVGITASFQNALMAFEERVAVIQSGTVTNADATGITLEDSSATFISNNINRGDIIYNVPDGSRTVVLSVPFETILITKGLIGGTDNQWDNTDSYEIYDVEQCNISGGNLVAVDGLGDSIDPALPTFGTQVVRTSSSSATLQELQDIQFASYNGGVTIDISNGVSGIAHPIGTPRQPVNNITDALIIATTVGLSKLYINGNITFDTGHNIDNFDIVGESPNKTVITVNAGASCLYTEFHEACMIGTFDTGAHFHECQIRNVFVDAATFYNCLFEEFTTTLIGSGLTHIISCYSAVPGSATPIFDFNSFPASVGIRDYNGGITLQNKSGSQSVSIDMNSGHVILDSTVTNGLILVRGIGKITNNSVGATVDVTHLVSPLSVADAVLDETLSEHTTAGSLGKAIADIEIDSNEIQGKLPTGNIGDATQASVDALPDATSLADAVWAEDITAHQGVDSAGEALKTGRDESLFDRKLSKNRAVISADGLLVTIYDDDNLTILQQYNVSADKKLRTPV